MTFPCGGSQFQSTIHFHGCWRWSFPRDHNQSQQSPNMYHETNLQRGCFHLILAYIGYVSISWWLNHVKLPISDDKTTHFEWVGWCFCLGRSHCREAMAESSPVDVNAAAMKSAEVWGVKKLTTLWGYKVGRMGYKKVMGIVGRMCFWLVVWNIFYFYIYWE